MRFFNLLTELLPVDARPTLIKSPVHSVVQVNFPIINLPGGNLDVDVRVVGVAVNRGDGSRLREIFL